jgi:23S rRNA (cytosine1962-C5)-methyltransferase
MPGPSLVLKPGREKSVVARHPWIFSGAVAGVVGAGQPGEPAAVLSSKDEFLAWADYNPHSQITARIWSWDESQRMDTQLISQRIDRAVKQRAAILSHHWGMECDAFRLVYAEADDLPGLIVDRYADYLVVQFLTAGIEYWREPVIDALCAQTGAAHVYERSDVDVRALEGLPLRKGALRGEAPADHIPIQENGLKFLVDLREGHKTGFYLDQRLNRLLAQALVQGKDVLDCFCYSGGFTCAAAAGGAKSVMAVDASSTALEMVKRNLRLNQFEMRDITVHEADVFQFLRQLRDRNRSFDFIVLDPPKFAHSKAQVERAARGYKDINLLAFKLLRPGGMLATFSCSGNIDEALFQKIVAGAALDAQVNVQILQRLQQAPDHPVGLHFPESAYLKGFLMQRIDD